MKPHFSHRQRPAPSTAEAIMLDLVIVAGWGIIIATAFWLFG